MPTNLSYEMFVLHNEAATNDQSRPGDLIWEYHEVAGTVASNVWEAEVPTALGEILGVVGLGYMSTFGSGDMIHGLSTDGVISTSAVTVRATTVSIADGALTTRLWLVGKKSTTVLFNTPDNP